MSNTPDLLNWPDRILAPDLSADSLRKWLQGPVEAFELQRATRLLDTLAIRKASCQPDEEVFPGLVARELIDRQEAYSRREQMTLYTTNLSPKALRVLAWSPLQATKIFSNIPLVRSDRRCAREVLDVYFQHLSSAVVPTSSKKASREWWADELADQDRQQLTSLVAGAIEGFLFQHDRLPPVARKQLTAWIARRLKRCVPRVGEQDSNELTPAEAARNLEIRLLNLEGHQAAPIFEESDLCRLYRSHTAEEGHVHRGLLMEAANAGPRLWQEALEAERGRSREQRSYVINKILGQAQFRAHQACRKKAYQLESISIYKRLLPHTKGREFQQVFRKLAAGCPEEAGQVLIRHPELLEQAQAELGVQDLRPLLMSPTPQVRAVALRASGHLASHSPSL